MSVSRLGVPLGVLVVFNLVSIGLWLSAAKHDRHSAWLIGQPLEFSQSGPFVAEGRLISPSSATLLSRAALDLMAPPPTGLPGGVGE